MLKHVGQWQHVHIIGISILIYYLNTTAQLLANSDTQCVAGCVSDIKLNYNDVWLSRLNMIFFFFFF